MSKSENIPNHIGLILDGNRRWAKDNGLSSHMGHRKGAEVLRQVSREFLDKGVCNLSVFLFSVENWNRYEKEVSFLMNLLKEFMNNYLEEAMGENVRVLVLGSREALNKPLLATIDKVEKQTEKNSRATVSLCINYGGKQEIVDALKAIVDSGVQSDEIDEELVSKSIYGGELVPDLDMIVRTSGEKRLSGFMIWRAAYAELMFVDKHWPDFDIEDVDKVLKEYSNRKRRFGK